jgi:hypothetical protein
MNEQEERKLFEAKFPSAAKWWDEQNQRYADLAWGCLWDGWQARAALATREAEPVAWMLGKGQAFIFSKNEYFSLAEKKIYGEPKALYTSPPSAQALFNAGLKAAAEVCKEEEAKLIGMKRLDVALGTSVCADRIQRLIGQPVPVQEKVPEGWKLVPIEPTKGMIGLGCTELANAPASTYGVELVHTIYRAMLAAAPTADAERSE